jgi:hypothetical protein
MKAYVSAAVAGSAVLAALAMPAAAAPQLSPLAADASIVHQARSDCRWVDNKWTYRKGDKVIVCRPDRPRGRDWTWHREGNRFGWWNRANRAWHHNAW